MYRPYLTPLPFPLLCLCLKVVPLLLPTGISARKVPSARHVLMLQRYWSWLSLVFRLSDIPVYPIMFSLYLFEMIGSSHHVAVVLGFPHIPSLR